MNKQAWAAFWLLTLIWGSSFLLMRVGVREIPPAQLTLIRVGIAAIGTNAVLLLTKRRYPTDWKTIRALIIIGIGNSAVPFTLLAWGEKTVESGLTAVIQAITPVFTMIIAHFWFEDERITPNKIIGIALGFLGIVVLSSGESFEGQLPGQIAIVIASLCYAVMISYSRKVLQAKVEPLVISGVAMIGAVGGAVVLMLLSPLVGELGYVPFNAISPDVLNSALALGFFNTFIAYLVFYSIIAALGASRTSMVTFTVPVVAVTLGAVFLHEEVVARLLLGAGLILGGIAFVNLRQLWRPKPVPAAQQG
jgi:drug/metabolite transporter (DMT)-like permease